jgi:hypothetical protein
MPYQAGSRLGAESASKLGHLAVVNSEWVRSLVIDFDQVTQDEADTSGTVWETFDPTGVQPLRTVWAVDGSYARVKTELKPSKEVAFVKTALLTIDRGRLDTIDKRHPHPLLLQDILRDSAVFHATVFPLKNIKTPLGTNFDAVRNIIHDSMKVDERGAFFETLKWLAYKKWNTQSSQESPRFQCPHCDHERDGMGYDLEEDECPECRERCFLTDMLGFHLDMDEDSAPDSVASAYMTMMEHLMLFTAVRLLWNHSDPGLVGETLFIRDGPMTLRGQYWKLVPRIRDFLQHAIKMNRPIHIVGQEKTGAFVDHLGSISRFACPQAEGDPASFVTLSHGYISKEVHRRAKRANPYGERTNWGEKLYLKLDPRTKLVLNVPTGDYKPDNEFPSSRDMIGLKRILATIPSLISRKHEDGLYPIELANAVASMSSYPSAKVLQRFMEG